MSIAGMFSKQVLRSGLIEKPVSNLFGGAIARYSKIWEPDYLILATTKPQEYDKINVQLKGFDFVVLERYQKLIIKIANMMNINISDKWATPQQDLVIHHYKPFSTEVKYEYNMRLSERNVQVIDVKGHIMVLFIEAILTTCPPGVNISIHEHDVKIEENRYIPHLGVLELQEQLENIGKKKDQKKKKRC